MNVIFTGQPGLAKENVIKNLVNAIKQDSGIDPSLFEKEKILGVYSMEASIAPKVVFKAFLEAPDPELRDEKWTRGAEKLLAQMRKDGNKNNFIYLHCAYRKHGEYFSHLNWDLLSELKPDLFITFIDDIFDIYWRLKNDQRLQQSDNFVLREIIEWRALEIILTDQLARFLVKETIQKNYIVAIKHPSSLLSKIILQPTAMRMYAAFPISDVRNDPEARKVINNHKLNLHKDYVAFDPSTIDEMILNSAFDAWKAGGGGKPVVDLELEKIRWPIKEAGFELPLLSDGIAYPERLELNPGEIEDALDTVSSQVDSRDYRLIRQSNIMSAYRPNFKNKTSVGVEKEISFTGLKMKIPYQYWPPEDGEPKHPFLKKGNFSTDYDEYLEMLRRHQEELTNSKAELSHSAQFSLT